MWDPEDYSPTSYHDEKAGAWRSALKCPVAQAVARQTGVGSPVVEAEWRFTLFAGMDAGRIDVEEVVNELNTLAAGAEI